MKNVLIATTLVAGLIESIFQASEAANRAMAMISKAQEEGRDITNEELDQVRNRSREAMDKFRSLR